MNRRVLIIDDEACFTDLLALNLEAEGGFEVACVNRPEKAVRQALAWSPDVILLDLIMPGMSGEEVYREMRGVPLLADVPVIVMSATELPARTALRGAGVHRLPKPMPLDALLDLIRRCVPPLARVSPGEPSLGPAGFAG